MITHSRAHIIAVALTVMAAACDHPTAVTEQPDDRSAVPPVADCAPNCLGLTAPGGRLPAIPGPWPFYPEPGYSPAVLSGGYVTQNWGLWLAIVDNNKRLWFTRYLEGTWSAWTNLGGVNTSAPAMSPQGWYPHFYARGSDNQLWVREKDSSKPDTWKDWYPVGGAQRSATGVYERQTEKPFTRRVTAVGSDQALWTNSWADDCACWRGWITDRKPAEGFKLDAATAVAGDGNSHIFARTSKDRLAWSFLPDRWSDAGIDVTAGGPAWVFFYAAILPEGYASSDGNEMLLVTGPDHRIYYNLHRESGVYPTTQESEAAEWTGWTRLDSDFQFSSGPAATLVINLDPMKGPEIVVVAFDSNVMLRTRSFSLKTGTWSSGWRFLGG